jgi:hypothetical protein
MFRTMDNIVTIGVFVYVCVYVCFGPKLLTGPLVNRPSGCAIYIGRYIDCCKFLISSRCDTSRYLAIIIQE